MGWTSQPRYDKSRNSWFCRYKNRKHYLGTDMGKAYRRFAEIIGQDAGDAPPMTVTGAIDQWLRTHGKAVKGWEDGMLRSWYHCAGMTSLADIGADHLVGYAEHLKALRHADGNRKGQPSQSPRTVRHKVTLATTVLKWCHGRDLIDKVPTKPKLPRPMQRPRDLPAEQIANTFATLPVRAKRLVSFILDTGCRPKEARMLHWDDVNLDRRQCTLTSHKTVATGKPRCIVLTPVAVNIIKSTGTKTGYVFRSRLGKPYARSGLRSILRLHGINNVYSLRHTRAQGMLDSGVPMEVVAEWLGHSNLQTVGVYAQVRAARLHEVASNLYSALPQPPPALPGQRTQTSERKTPAKTKANRRRPATARARRSA